VQAQTFTDTFLVIAACFIAATLILPLMHKWCRQRRHIDVSTASRERLPRHRTHLSNVNTLAPAVP
jgi:hypothetical protein